MSNKPKHSYIPLLNPVVFKQKLIDSNWTPPNKLKVDEFFIHSFKDEEVPLKLPLPLHKKTVHDFALVIKGKMTKTIGMESFPLQAQQFLFTPKNSITTTKDVTKDLEGYYCHFSDDFIAHNPFLNQWNNQSVAQNLLILKEEEINILLPLLERIAVLYREGDKNPQNYRLIPFYLSAFMAEVSLISERKVVNVKINPIATRFRQLVNQRFKESKSAQFYAELLHVSPNHLNKIIKKETGKTVSDFIRSICVLEAKVLLIQTDSDISEVAYELGFEDTSYFSRFFKKHTGTSPAEYRKMIDLS